MPVLSDIPVLGPVLFKQNIFVYFSIFIVIISTYYLFKTAYGLRARAVGEHPKAAETLGISVLKTRFHHVIMGGMIAGFGGADYVFSHGETFIVWILMAILVNNCLKK